MRFLLYLMVFCFGLSARAQLRLGLQTGLSGISESGISAQLASTFSFGFQFDNNISWGLQYGTTLKNEVSGNDLFYYCDSLEQAGWAYQCVGTDSMINSAHTSTYNVNSLGLFFLKHKAISNNEKLDLAGGIRCNLNFISRREQRFNPLLGYDQTNKALGGSISPLIRLAYKPNPKKSDFSFFLEASTGVFISPQWQCEDANCDNFLTRAVNSSYRIQLGIAY